MPPLSIRRRHLTKSIRCCQNFVRFVKLSDGGLGDARQGDGGTAAGKHRVVRLTQTDKPHDEAGYSSIIAVRSLCRLLARVTRVREKSFLPNPQKNKITLQQEPATTITLLTISKAGKKDAFLVPLRDHP